MFASHLGVPRAASAVMSGGAEEPRAGMAPAAAQSAHKIVAPRGDNDRTSELPGVDVPGVDVPGVDSPGSGLTRPPAGPGSARGRDSLGLRVAPVRHSL